MSACSKCGSTNTTPAIEYSDHPGVIRCLERTCQQQAVDDAYAALIAATEATIELPGDELLPRALRAADVLTGTDATRLALAVSCAAMVHEGPQSEAALACIRALCEKAGT